MAKNYGFNHTLEAYHQDGTEWKFGAGSLQALFTLSKEERLSYLPMGEVQRGTEDMMDCATRGPINLLEALFTYGVQNSKFSSKNVAWLRAQGYLKNGRVTFSDAFIAIKSGTTREGNSMKAPLQAIHQYGLIPKAMLPLQSTMSFDDYMDPKRITGIMEDLGRAFAARFTINYEQVEDAAIKQLNEQEMLVVAGHAWPVPVNAIYLRNDGPVNHVWLNVFPEYYAFDNYIDVDGDFIKILASNYAFYHTKYRVFISKETSDVVDSAFSIEYALQLIKKLQEIIKNITMIQQPQAEQSIPVVAPADMQERLYTTARDTLGYDASPNNEADKEVACANSVCSIIRKILPDFPMILGTMELYKYLQKDKRFIQTLDIAPGSIIISPTGSGNGKVRGHTGIIGENNTIMSNDSATGLWQQNYTIDTWVNRWRTYGGMKIYVFKAV